MSSTRSRLLGVLVAVPLTVVMLGMECPWWPGGGSEEDVLAGDWQTMDADDNLIFARFNDSGVLQGFLALNEDDEAALVIVSGATSAVDGTAVTITFPTAAGSGIFTGTLAADENSMTGTLSSAIQIGDDIIVIVPQGEVTLTRVTELPCPFIACEDGEECVDGVCVPVAECVEDADCVEGEEECIDGACVPVAECVEDADCVEGEEECIDGTCVPISSGGDPVAGEAFYTDNGCAVCHGASAEGGIGPSLVGLSSEAVCDTISGGHGAISSAMTTDCDNLSAWFAGL